MAKKADGEHQEVALILLTSISFPVARSSHSIVDNSPCQSPRVTCRIPAGFDDYGRLFFVLSRSTRSSLARSRKAKGLLHWSTLRTVGWPVFSPIPSRLSQSESIFASSLRPSHPPSFARCLRRAFNLNDLALFPGIRRSASPLPSSFLDLNQTSSSFIKAT